MKLLLAPMEGVVDHSMRTLLSSTKDSFDLCVTEFVRVSQNVIPAHTFKRFCPELDNHCRTPSGTPVYIQLLGSDPELMAESAVQAAKLGAYGIDINFGCPAKTVNRHGGGATLLQDPKQIESIVSCVRKHLPADVPLSAKMRLGYEDKSLVTENAQAIESGGAHMLTIHARTKLESYKPPAHWHYIAKVKEKCNLEIIANGDIWTLEDYKNCRDASGCESVMLGRSALRNPLLAAQIKAYVRDPSASSTGATWSQITPLILQFCQLTQEHYPEKYLAPRTKQWLRFIAQGYDEAEELFKLIRTKKDPDEIYALIRQHC